MKRALAAVLGAGLLLAGCGQSSPPAATTSSTADGVNHLWTASTAEGQGLYAALSQGLKSQDFNVGLSITATNGWGPIELNTSNGEFRAGDGHPITLNGKVYSTGLGVHADSEIHIHATNLETPACTRFQADVGVDDEVGDNGSVVFQVFADGVKLFDSGVMTGASATQHIDVGIGNKSDLRFVVTNGGDNYSFDHADWAGAAITCATQAAPSVTLDKSSLDIYHLHSGTLHATFNNYPKGTVKLALTADPNVPIDPNDPYFRPNPYPLVLQTTEVELSGLPSETKDIVVSAPTNPMTDQDTGRFLLQISATGIADQQLPVSLYERPLKLSLRFEPNSFSGREGETKTGVAIVTIDPPLDGPRALSFGYANPELTDGGRYKFALVGPTTGTGSELRINVAVTIGYYPAQYLPQNNNYPVSLGIDGVTTGYRDNFYGWYQPSDTLYLTHLP